MKLGVRAKSLKMKDDFYGLASWLKKNGFEAVDMLLPDEKAKKICDSFGLEVGTFNTLPPGKVLTRDEGKRKAALTELKDQLSCAARMGLATWFFTLVPEDITLPRVENFKIWENVFPELVYYAESLNLKIAMEGWCYDPSHLVRLNIDYLRFLEKFGDRIHFAHAKDCLINKESLFLYGTLNPTFMEPKSNYNGGYWRYCVPGKGEVNWQKAIEGLRAVGYGGILSIELEDDHYMQDAEANKTGLLFAKDYLAPFLKAIR